jgi:hypothetical protein
MAARNHFPREKLPKHCLGEKCDRIILHSAMMASAIGSGGIALPVASDWASDDSAGDYHRGWFSAASA